MFAKGFLVFCASALFTQCAHGQCFGRIAEPNVPCRAGLGYDGFGFDGFGYDAAWPRRAGCGAIAPAADLAASHGGGLSVTSSSCAAPTGLAITSDNAYEGGVAVSGNLPFLGTAGMEGVFPTAGTSVISYGCGDGAVAITAEAPISAAYAPNAFEPAVIAPAALAPAAVAPAMGTWGYKVAQACGCGAPYFN